ncbi:MAG: HipA domain-containing protein [Oligoflexia bacterium]|nr:HipA domain-containing protein [Oligoflexia bacterium]
MQVGAPKEIAQAKVFKGEKMAGILSRTQNGALFEYDPLYFDEARNDATRAVAYRMPLTSRRYSCSGINLHPFFAGLLPEGLRLEALQSQIKSSRDDMFSILMASRPDIIGDVWISDTGKTPKKPKPIAKLEEVLFDDLFQSSIRAANRSAPSHDLTIAGIQGKISARMISFPVKIRSRNHEYILKLTPKDYPLLVENEAFFMHMAWSCGLATAPVKLVRDRGGNAGLLVRRFDRIYDRPTKRFNRIHQEDACQFLDRYPADKYRIGLSEIAAGIEELSTAPVLEILELLKVTAFSYLIGNGDMHAKNISLITEPGTGRVRLSPAYDLLSTVPYGDLRMAIRMEGRDDNLKLRDFVAFGERFGLRPTVVQQMLDKLCRPARAHIGRVSQIGFEKKVTEQIKKLAVKRIEELTH